MISLHEWAKREHVSYSHAQKLFNEGQIVGAVRDGRKIQVPEDSTAPVRECVTCAVCGRQFPQITGTHLRAHSLTMADYKIEYPSAPLMAQDIRSTIIATHLGKPKTDEHKARVSSGRTGIVPKNHPRYVRGVYHDSDETKEKKRLGQLGRTHTPETKQKIGDKHRGKKLSQAQVAGMSISTKLHIAEYGHPFSGKTHNADSRARMAIGAVLREANYTAERLLEISAKKSIGNLGKRRTAAQKETYSEARVKWMSENPTKFGNTLGERSIAAWLDEHCITYQRQFRVPGARHPYDFFLPDYQTIIEFDGAHHWLGRWWEVVGTTEAEKEEALRHSMEKDATESLIAGLSGYRIIRVRGKNDCGDTPEYGSLEDQLRLQGFVMPAVQPTP